MKYRLLFFMTEITLLVMVGAHTFKTRQWYTEFYAESGDLLCLNANIGPSVFLLLIVMDILLVGLFFWPENDVLWWLNLVGLVTLVASVFTCFSPGHVLVALSIVFGLAYRRLLGLKHIWHWRGGVVVGLGVLTGLINANFGMERMEMWLDLMQG
jgi:hypothetical protein